MRIQKCDSNSVFYNILHKLKNASNNSKLLKRVFIKKENIIINQKILLQKNIYKHLYY